MDITFALSPFCFSLSFPSPGAWSSLHIHITTMDFISCGHLHSWVPPSSFTWIGPFYLVTYLDARISPNRFHQLTKTKLALSESLCSFAPQNPKCMCGGCGDKARRLDLTVTHPLLPLLLMAHTPDPLPHIFLERQILTTISMAVENCRYKLCSYWSTSYWFIPFNIVFSITH